MSSAFVRVLKASAAVPIRHALSYLTHPRYTAHAPRQIFIRPEALQISEIDRKQRFMSTSQCKLRIAKEVGDDLIYQHAKNGNSKQIAELLKANKVDLSRKDAKGYTVLHYAAMNGYGDDMHGQTAADLVSKEGGGEIS
eukprot:754619-Hanusia_phi.AAC.4